MAIQGKDDRPDIWDDALVWAMFAVLASYCIAAWAVTFRVFFQLVRE